MDWTKASYPRTIRSRVACGQSRQWHLMRPITALIVGLHVLAHSIFGCCGHALASPSQNAATGSLCRCHKIVKPANIIVRSHQVIIQRINLGTSSDCSKIGHDQFTSDQHVCSHGACHWVAPQYVSIADVLASYDDFNVAALTATCASLTVSHSLGLDLGTMAAPPLRAHLVLNVLRI